MAELKIIDRAPDKGIAFISFRDSVDLKRYTNKEMIKEEVSSKIAGLLELHMFDSDSEYRAVMSRKSETGFIETVVSGSDDNGEVYEETIFIEDRFKSEVEKITVVNYLTYDDNDLISISNYRLKEVGSNG